MAKSDNLVVRRRIQDVSRLILSGAEFSDIRQYAAEQGWDVGDRQLSRYLKIAYERMARALQRDKKQLVGRHVMQRKALYARAVKANDLRSALQILKDEAELEGLYPPTKIAPTTPDGRRLYTPSSGMPLTRRERVVHLIQAEVRQDRTELKLVEQATPMKYYRLADTHLPVQLLHILALSHVSEQLEVAGMYLFAAWSVTLDDGEDPEGLLELMLAVNAYLYRVGHDGWRQFTDGLKIDGQWLIDGNYAGQLLGLCNVNLLPLAPEPEYVLEVIRSVGITAEGELLTAEAIAKSWRRMFGKVCV